MSKSGKRSKQKIDVNKVANVERGKKKEKDWSFDDILRSKTRRR